LQQKARTLAGNGRACQPDEASQISLGSPVSNWYVPYAFAAIATSLPNRLAPKPD